LLAKCKNEAMLGLARCGRGQVLLRDVCRCVWWDVHILWVVYSGMEFPRVARAPCARQPWHRTAGRHNFWCTVGAHRPGPAPSKAHPSPWPLACSPGEVLSAALRPCPRSETGAASEILPGKISEAGGTPLWFGKTVLAVRFCGSPLPALEFCQTTTALEGPWAIRRCAVCSTPSRRRARRSCLDRAGRTSFLPGKNPDCWFGNCAAFPYVGALARVVEVTSLVGLLGVCAAHGAGHTGTRADEPGSKSRGAGGARGRGREFLGLGKRAGGGLSGIVRRVRTMHTCMGDGAGLFYFLW
jgi:hypothetical protein